MKIGPDNVYLTGTPPLPERLVLNGLRADVDDHARTAALPDHCPDMEDAFARLASAELDAMAPHPIDSEASLADGALLADAARHSERVATAERRASDVRTILTVATDVLVKTPPCWSRSRLLALSIVYLALAALVAIPVGVLLTTTLDSSFLGNYFADKADDPDAVAMWISFGVAAGMVFGQCALQLTYVVSVRGEVSTLRKSGLLAFDLLFAVAWGVQRLEGGGHAMAVSVTAIEFAATAFFTWAVGGLADALKRNAPRIEPYRDAESAVDAAKDAVKDAEKHLDQAEKDRHALLGPLAAREAAVRAALARRAAAELTARVEYRITIAALAADAAKNPTLDALVKGLDEHTSIFQRRLDRTANGGKP